MFILSLLQALSKIFVTGHVRILQGGYYYGNSGNTQSVQERRNVSYAVSNIYLISDLTQPYLVGTHCRVKVMMGAQVLTVYRCSACQVR